MLLNNVNFLQQFLLIITLYRLSSPYRTPIQKRKKDNHDNNLFKKGLNIPYCAYCLTFIGEFLLVSIIRALLGSFFIAFYVFFSVFLFLSFVS